MNFWSQFELSQCVPDCSCEIMLNGFIAQPFAFWSSLFYLIFAWFLYAQVKDRSFIFRLWIFLVILLGVSSMITHASFTLFGVAMDFASIVVIISFFTFVKMMKLLKRSDTRTFQYLIMYYFILWMAFIYMPKWAKIGLCVLIFLFSVTDLVRALGQKFFQARSLQISLLIMGISFGLFLMDEFRIGCHPEGWLHGHTLWHYGTAWAIYYFGKWNFLESGTKL